MPRLRALWPARAVEVRLLSAAPMNPLEIGGFFAFRVPQLQSAALHGEQRPSHNRDTEALSQLLRDQPLRRPLTARWIAPSERGTTSVAAKTRLPPNRVF